MRTAPNIYHRFLSREYIIVSPPVGPLINLTVHVEAITQAVQGWWTKKNRLTTLQRT